MGCGAIENPHRSQFLSYDFRQIRPINAVFTNILSTARTLPIGGQPQMTVIDIAEARKARRGRVMDLALIRFGAMSVGCVVRNLNDEGAALDVGPQTDIPDQFTLVVIAKKKIYSCNIVWRKDSHIGVSFR
jgi:hypothetical protein